MGEGSYGGIMERYDDVREVENGGEKGIQWRDPMEDPMKGGSYDDKNPMYRDREIINSNKNNKHATNIRVLVILNTLTNHIQRSC